MAFETVQMFERSKAYRAFVPIDQSHLMSRGHYQPARYSAYHKNGTYILCLEGK
jgi:hypothetical protein